MAVGHMRLRDQTAPLPPDAGVGHDNIATDDGVDARNRPLELDRVFRAIAKDTD